MSDEPCTKLETWRFPLDRDESNMRWSWACDCGLNAADLADEHHPYPATLLGALGQVAEAHHGSKGAA